MPNTYVAEIDSSWYAFAWDMNTNQVSSIGTKDSVSAELSCEGIKQVSIPQTYGDAYKRATAHGTYHGEF